MMNTATCDGVLESVLGSLQAGFSAYTAEDGVCVVVTPLTHPDLAAIELYAKPLKSGQIRLSDEGETLNILFVNGLHVERNAAIREDVQRIAQIHGVRFENSVLSLEAGTDELGVKSRQLLSAIQAVSYLIYKRRQSTPNLFEEEIETLFTINGIAYSAGYTIRGLKAEHEIAYHINGRRNILIDPLTATNIYVARSNAARVGFKMADLLLGNDPHRFFVILDDSKDKWGTLWLDASVQQALSYSSRIIRWSTEQQELVSLLMATPE